MSPFFRIARSFGDDEALAVEFVRDGLKRPRRSHPRHAAVAVLAEDQLSLRVARESVAALRTGARGFTGRAARLEKHLGVRHAILPAVSDVHRHVGKDDAVTEPHRPLGPLEVAGEPLDLCAGRDELVERGVESLDGAFEFRRINAKRESRQGQ